MFGRQAWVGLTNTAYGTFTAGRQYTSYYTLLSPYSPTNWLTGFLRRAPGRPGRTRHDLPREQLARLYVAEALRLHGERLVFVRGRSGQREPGLDLERRAAIRGKARSASRSAFTRINNSTPGGGVFGADSTTQHGRPVGRVGGDERLSARRRRSSASRSRAATRSTARGTSRSRTRTSSTSRASTRASTTWRSGTRAASCCTGRPPRRGTSARATATRARPSRTVSRARRNTSSSTCPSTTRSRSARVSTRCEAFQRANGQTLGTPGASSVINATATIGDGFQTAPSSSRSMFAAGVGIIHRF